MLTELPSSALASIATGRAKSIFEADFGQRRADLVGQYKGSAVLVVGGAGSIGSAVTHLLLELRPASVVVLDHDENRLAALTREIRGLDADLSAIALRFLPLDFGAWPALSYLEHGPRFDFVLNFAAVKHVRSEKDVYSLLQMLDTNVVKQRRFLEALARAQPQCRYFVVSTDKAADPGNFMGATKRLLEQAAFLPPPASPPDWRVSSARFANVAFSNGSLLESFVTRFRAGAPLSAPRDTRRYFISAREAAEICVLGQQFCPHATIAIPRLSASENAIELAAVAGRFLEAMGRQPVFVDSLEEARRMLRPGSPTGKTYPVVLTLRDTSGEKEIEVFAGAGEQLLELGLSELVAVVPAPAPAELAAVLRDLASMTDGTGRVQSTGEILRAIQRAVPNFRHVGGEHSLDDRF